MNVKYTLTSTYFSSLLLGLYLATVANLAHAGWLDHEKWDEGLAEVCLYEGKQMKYGKLRSTSVDLITVREQFNPRKLVKTDPKPEALPVMKQNLIRRTRTGVYEYLQMGSSFVDRRSGQLLKISSTSAEWCGNSHATITLNGDGYDCRIANYFNDQGIVDARIDRVDLFEDQLLMHLRQNLPTLNVGQKFNLIKTLVTNKPVLAYETVVIEAIKGSKLTLAFPAHTETFEFDSDELRALKKWSNSNGEYLKRRKKMFSDYWNKNTSGDERLLR